MIPSLPAAFGLIQAISVYAALPTGMFAPVGRLTYWPLPLKLKALPTSPAACVAPPTRVPGLPPAMSGAVVVLLPSPVHQPTRPEGGATAAAVTVRLTMSLVALADITMTPI